MHEAVSDVLIDRSREANGISTMLLVSLLAHGMLIAALIVMPANWRSTSNVIPRSTN